MDNNNVNENKVHEKEISTGTKIIIVAVLVFLLITLTVMAFSLVKKDRLLDEHRGQWEEYEDTDDVDYMYVQKAKYYLVKYGYGSSEENSDITEYLYRKASKEHYNPIKLKDGNTYYFSSDDVESIVETAEVYEEYYRDYDEDNCDDEDIELYLPVEPYSNDEVTVEPHYSDEIGDLPLKKPVIYLYNYNDEEVNVQVDLKNAMGELTCAYPEYKENVGWTVTAQPDGHLIDSQGKVYKYLYWEGIAKHQWSFDEGFCVKGEDTAEFLEKTLKRLGLSDDETNEFIIYWLPEMQDNKYNIISFQTDDYTNNVELKVTPEPTSVIRVYMTWKPSNEYINIKEQKLTKVDRVGKTVVEWGGTKIE